MYFTGIRDMETWLTWFTYDSVMYFTGIRDMVNLLMTVMYFTGIRDMVNLLMTLSCILQVLETWLTYL